MEEKWDCVYVFPDTAPGRLAGTEMKCRLEGNKMIVNVTTEGIDEYTPEEDQYVKMVLERAKKAVGRPG